MRPLYRCCLLKDLTFIKNQCTSCGRKCLWTQILTNWIFLSVRNFIEKGKLDHNQSPVPAKTTHFSGNCAGRLRDKCQMTSSFHAIQCSKYFFHSSNLNIPPKFDLTHQLDLVKRYISD